MFNAVPDNHSCFGSAHLYRYCLDTVLTSKTFQRATTKYYDSWFFAFQKRSYGTSLQNVNQRLWMTPMKVWYAKQIDLYDFRCFSPSLVDPVIALTWRFRPMNELRILDGFQTDINSDIILDKLSEEPAECQFLTTKYIKQIYQTSDRASTLSTEFNPDD